VEGLQDLMDFGATVSRICRMNSCDEGVIELAFPDVEIVRDMHPYDCLMYSGRHDCRRLLG